MNVSNKETSVEGFQSVETGIDLLNKENCFKVVIFCKQKASVNLVVV